MKFIAFILSTYILALNLSPCEDNIPSASDVKVEISQAEDNGHKDLDLCSPFCQCHCCHVHTIDFGLTSFEPLVAIISSEIFTHFDSLGEEIQYSIFQPPRA